uniref:Protein ABCI7, chloroplastic n=1 Tax=Tanacetum cinerariifolium TaxID=118510 RepID=A0A6L2MHR5_TANCI|nr:protein ABCI7, chloroplastic [Tanacetum cinerariifolium]
MGSRGRVVEWTGVEGNGGKCAGGKRDACVNLTTDVWSAPHGLPDSYMCVTAHWIKPDTWQIMKRVISFEEFSSPHTGHALFKMLIKVLTNFNLEDKVMSITLDNASNNTSAMDKLKLKYDPPMGNRFYHSHCVAHIINLVVQAGSGVPAIDAIKESFKTMLKDIFKSSVRTRQRYVKIWLPKGVFVGSFNSIESTELTKRVLEFLPSHEKGDLFWSLNGVGSPDLVVVYVPEGCKVESLLHLRYVSSEGSDKGSKKLPVSNPRVLVVVEKGGEIGIVEEYMSGDGDAELSYWSNSVLEIVVAEEAKVSHSYIQTQSLNSAHIKWTSIRQEKSSTYELVETDAGQLTRSLILEPRATVNVKPNLQIIADDVKCSHGAAIYDLEEDQLFYLRARGIDLQTARQSLIISFAAEVIARFPSSDLRKKVESHVKKLLNPPVPVEKSVNYEV